MAKSLGAAVVATPAVKSNEVISNGVVDSHFGINGDGMRSFQLTPYTKSMTRLTKPVYSTSFSFFINKDKWAEISPEDQEAIRSISQEKVGMTAAQLWYDKSEEVHASFESLGIDIVDVDPALEEALVAASEPIAAAWMERASAAGIDGEAALAFYKKRLAELSK
jgi:TRAP-type C4-dicarboxylate transport system substrate-binding protein